MADADSLYPKAPSGIPGDLARPGLRYALQAVLVRLSSPGPKKTAGLEKECLQQ